MNKDKVAAEFKIFKHNSDRVFRYTIQYGEWRVPRVTMTLFGARWWIKHRSKKWLGDNTAGETFVESHLIK